MISLDALYLELKSGMAWNRWTELRDSSIGVTHNFQFVRLEESKILQIKCVAGYFDLGEGFTRPDYVYIARPAEFYVWAEESGIWPQADLDRCLVLVTRDLNR